MQKLDKKTIIYISVIVIILVVIYYLFIKKDDYIENETNLNILNTYEKNNQIEENSLDTKDINNKIVIYITGSVKNEGIYELEENSRIADSIEKAGGLTEEANISDINLAYVLEDGMKIYIPKKGENNNEKKDDTNAYVSKENNDTGNGENSKNTNKSTSNIKININTATQAELETLPGIGPSISLKIINYRKENGKFSSIEDIKKVNGIGESKYSKIKNLIKT